MKVFFDLDGVLIDGWHAKPERRRPWDVNIEQDIGISREALQHTLFTPTGLDGESRISACARGAVDLKDVLADILPGLGYSGPADSFLDYWFRKDSHLNPEVLDCVRSLRRSGKVELYLATNQEHHRMAYLWDHLKLKELFHDVFYSARLGILKNEVAFFTTINAQLGVAASEQPLFFDDTEKVVMTARAAGWDAHLFDTAETLSKNRRLQEILER